MIAGQSPRLKWHDNPGGQKRTIEEALAIAQKNGVAIPDDVEFFEADEHELPDDTTARRPKVTKVAGAVVSWTDLVNSLTGKVPFLVYPHILKSDEAIVAVLGHELFELQALRDILKKGKTSIESFIAQTCPGNPGNLHDEAWDHADKLVEQMRNETKP